MRKDDCIFCKIANGEIPSNTVYEDNDFRAFLDLSPASEGHTLVVTKEHFDDLFELGEKTGEKALLVVKKVAEAVKKATGCAGVNIVQNNGEAAGQTVRHLHFHIIPRYNDGSKLVAWEQHESDPLRQAELAKKIASEF